MALLRGSRWLFAALVLLFLGGMVGFALTGDLFNWFVFFELMSVAAFALTAYQAEEVGPIQGAFNFAVTNSLGAFMILTGIALLYGRTGRAQPRADRPPARRAVLRFAARVFLGWGVANDPLLSPQPEEHEPEEDEQPRPVLLTIAALLVAGALALGFAPGLASRALTGAEQFRDRQAYTAEVLEAQEPKPRPLPPQHTSAESVLLSLLTLAGTIAVAGWGLRGHPLPRLALAPLERLRALHSGAVGDYVAWLVLGTSVLGGLFTLAVR